MFGLVLTAIVLGVLGLIEFSTRAGVFVQGRAQAIWALSLAGVIGLFAVAGLISAIVRAARPSATAAQSRPGLPLTFDELNFRFRTPNQPWGSYNVTKFNKDSKLAFMRRFPEAYFLLIAEKIGTGRDFSTAQLAELGKARLQATAQSSRILSETSWGTNGIDGLLVETEAQLTQYSFYYLHWYVATNGYAYQLVGYGRSQDRQRLAGEFRQMFSRFALVRSQPGRFGGGRGLSHQLRLAAS